MDYAISIRLSEHQYYLLKEMARQQYRTLGNAYAMLAAEGLRFYFVDNESVYIKKKLDHCETSNPQRENYTEQELIDAFAKIPTQQP
jgi:hypothetical protein